MQKSKRKIFAYNRGRNPKKGYDHILQKVTDLIEHIEQEKENHPVQVLCEVLEVARSTYYQSFHKVKSTHAIENEAILARIKIIHAESKFCYGAPKIHQCLKKENFNVSLKRVQHNMKAGGIRSIITKKYRPSSSASQIEERDNLLEQDFETTTINEKWVADIT